MGYILIGIVIGHICGVLDYKRRLRKGLYEKIKDEECEKVAKEIMHYRESLSSLRQNKENKNPV